MTSSLQCILGGACSGKSWFALNQSDKRQIFMATAFARDEEMKNLIKSQQT